MHRLNKVQIEWSPNFAYAIGLLTTDGNLSSDGRHIALCSKDREMIDCFKLCLGLKNKIGRFARGGSKDKKYFKVQFGDKNFYEFLLKIGLKPAKSKTLDTLDVPGKYFTDFLRGCIDGDGNIDVSWHPESRHPQLRLRLCSASLQFLLWIKNSIKETAGVSRGWIEKNRSVHVLVYGKEDSVKLFSFMYYSGVEHYLERKYRIAGQFMRV